MTSLPRALYITTKHTIPIVQFTEAGTDTGHRFLFYSHQAEWNDFNLDQSKHVKSIQKLFFALRAVNFQFFQSRRNSNNSENGIITESVITRLKIKPRVQIKMSGGVMIVRNVHQSGTRCELSGVGLNAGIVYGYRGAARAYYPRPKTFVRARYGVILFLQVVRAHRLLDRPSFPSSRQRA